MGKYLAKVGSRNLGFPMERLKKSKYLPRSLQMDCSGALAAQEVEKFSPPQEKYHENDEGITRLHVLTKKLEKWMKDCASLLSVAAALVTTVTFLASITMPGSISIDNGLPIFVKAFVVSNMFTLLFSTASLLMFLCILGQKILCPLPWKLMFCGVLTLFMSIIAMIPAFCAGLLIVLGHKKPCLVIPVIVLYYVTATFFFVHQILFIVRMNKSTYYPDIFRKSSTPRQYTKGINSEANIPKYLKSALHYLFALVSNQITIVVEEHYDGGISRNQVYDAAEVYLRTKMSPEVRRFKVGKPPKQKSLDISVEKGEEIIDRFDNILELKWRFISVKPQNQNGYENEKRFFELSFNKKYRDRVLIEYLPFVLAKSKETKDNADDDSYGGGMTEHEPGLVDSTTIISMMDFDTADNSAHLMREYQSGLAVSLSENKSGGEALKREFVTKDSILGLVDLQQNSGGRRDDGAKSFGTIYDPGIHTTHSLARNSFKVLENPPMLETLAIYPKLMGKNSDLWKFLRRKNREEKPLVEFDSTNNSTYQSGLLVSNSENTNSREESKRWCVTERVLGSVDSTTRILSTDFDAAINSAHLVRPYQSGPVVSLSGNENRGEASKRECITKRILGSEDLQQNSGGRRDNAAKSFGAIYDPGIHPTHSLAQNSFEVLENPPMLETLAIYPKLMGKISDLWKFVRGKNREEKPLVEFDSTNNSAYQSGLLVSNSENTNSREESKRACMTERVLGSVDSTTRISSTDFDAADNTAHLGRACQSGPVVSLSGNANRGEASERECITERILGLEDLQQNFGDRCDNAAKSFGTIYDPVIHTTHSLAQNSLEVLDALPNQKQPNDSITLLSLGRLTLEGCVLEEKSQDLPRPMQINGVEQRVTKSPPYLGGFTAQSTSSSRWPISLPDGRHIVVLNPLEQSTKNVAHVARAPSVSLPEKMVRKTLKRKCRIMSVIYASHQKCFGKRCEGTAKSFRAMHICRNRGINWVSTVKRIHKQHGINKWPFCQKWATRKGYSLGEKRPYEVSSQSMDEKLVSKFLFIHMSQFPIFSPLPLTLPNSSEIVGPIALSSDKFAATNNRAHLVRQNQSGSTASHYERKNTRETLGRQRITESLSSIEDLQQHFAGKHKDAVKRLGVKVSIFKSSCRQHRVYWLPCQIIKSEQQAFDATSNIAHVLKADQGIPSVSCSEMENKRESLKRECSGLSLEDLPEHYGGRHEDAMKGLGVMTEKENKYDNKRVKMMKRFMRRNREKNEENKEVAMAKVKYLKDLLENTPPLKFVGKETKEEKLLVEFDFANIMEYQSGLLEKTNSREESKRPWMTEKVLGSVDSTTRISSTDFDAADNTAHLGGACQSGPVVSLSGNENRGEASKRECITERILGLEDLQQNSGGRRDNAAKSFGGIHSTHSLAQNSFEVLEALPTRKQPNDSVPLLSLGRFTVEGCVQEGKSQDLPRLVQIDGVEQRVTKSHRYLGGFTAQSTRSSRWTNGLQDGRHIVVLNLFEQSTKNVAHVARADQCSPTVPLPEKKMVRRTLKRKYRIMSVIFAIHQHFGKRCEGTAKSFRAMRICRNHGINQVSTGKRIHKQHGINQWPFRQKWVTRKGYSLGEKRPYEVSSLSMDMPRILKMDCSGGLDAQSAIGLPDGGYILSLSKKRVVGKTLKRNCRTTSLFSLEDHQQHAVRRWGDAAKSLGSKRICKQLGVQHASRVKCIHGQHVFHRWPFQQNWETMKAYSVRDKRPAEVLSLSMDGKLVSRLQLVHISWLVKFLPRPSAYQGGGEIVGPIALLSSEFAATNNRAHGIRNDQSGSSSASHFEEEIPGEPVDVEGTGSGISLEELQKLFDMKREDAAKILKVSVSTFKRICKRHGIKPWPYQARKKAVTKPPDRHRGMNTTGSSDDRRNLSASQEEPLLRGHVSGPIHGTIPTCTDPAPGQPTTIVPHPRGNLLASEEEVLLWGHVSGPIYGTISSCTEPAPSQPTPIVPHPTEDLEDQRNLLTLPEEPLLSQITPTIPPTMDGFADWSAVSALFDNSFPEGHASGSIDCTAPTCSNPAPSQTTPTNATEMRNMDFVELKATYDDATFGNTTIKFQLPPKFETSELEEKVSKILKCELDSFRVEYKDKDDEWILMACDENVREYLQLRNSLGNQVTKLKITKVPNTANLCETCGSSLTRKRPRHA